MVVSKASTSLGTSCAASRNHCGAYKIEILNSCTKVAVSGSQPASSFSAATSNRSEEPIRSFASCRTVSSSPNDRAHADKTTCWLNFDKPGAFKYSPDTAHLRCTKINR